MQGTNNLKHSGPLDPLGQVLLWLISDLPNKWCCVGFYVIAFRLHTRMCIVAKPTGSSSTRF